MKMDALTLSYLIGSSVLLGSIGALYRLRQRLWYPHAKTKNLFRCKDCSHVYVDDHEVPLSSCPRCKSLNKAFKR